MFCVLSVIQLCLVCGPLGVAFLGDCESAREARIKNRYSNSTADASRAAIKQFKGQSQSIGRFVELECERVPERGPGRAQQLD